MCRMADECDLVVIDSTTGDAYLKEAKAKNAGAILADSVADMVAKILAKVSSGDCKCIKHLKIIGHGSEGRLIVGSGKTAEKGKHINGKAEDWEPELKKLKNIFCKNAEIEICACFFGATQAGVDKLAKIADVTGATAVGYNVYTWPGGEPKKGTKGYKKMAVKPGKPKPKAVDRAESKLPTLKGLYSRVPALLRGPGASLTVGRTTIRDPRQLKALSESIDPRRVNGAILGGADDIKIRIADTRGRRYAGFLCEDFRVMRVETRPHEFVALGAMAREWLRDVARR